MKVFFGLFLFLCAFTMNSFGKRSSRRLGTPCNCDFSNSSRIVRGKETLENEFPLMVSLKSLGRTICGGAILTERHVLTAAHCTYDEPVNSLRVIVGAHNLKQDQGIVHRVAKVIIHRKYNEKTLVNDIALLVTTARINFNQNVRPACLPSKRSYLVGQRVKAIGWGNTRANGYPSNVLKKVDLVVVPYNQCAKAWRPTKLLPNKNICTYEARKDTCQGDSGGPLLWLDPSTETHILVAVVSYGAECAGSLPSINTDVYAYMDFIEKNIESSKPKLRICTSTSMR